MVQLSYYFSLVSFHAHPFHYSTFHLQIILGKSDGWEPRIFAIDFSRHFKTYGLLAYSELLIISYGLWLIIVIGILFPQAQVEYWSLISLLALTFI